MYKQSFPQITTTKKTWHKLLDIISVASIIAGVILLIVFWLKMPETVPIHFNVKGEPDGWGSKYTLIILPIIAIGLFALLTFLEGKPHVYNYLIPITEQNAQIQFTLARMMMNVTKNLSTLLLMIISCYSIFQANGSEGTGLNMCLMIIFILMVLSIIYYFIQAIKYK